MAGSLRDQLVKAGLASSADAKKAERASRAKDNAQRKGKGKSQQKPGKQSAGKSAEQVEKTASAKQRANKLRAEKAARDRVLAEEQNKKAAAKALRAEIKQIILQNDQRAEKTTDTDVPYNFVHGKKIKRIHVPEAQKAQLIAGTLVIVNNDGLYHFVSTAVAQQIAKRDPKRIIVAHKDTPDEPTELSENDKFYAKFEVPDDLEW